jgi:hydroxypyruvate isomerase
MNTNHEGPSRFTRRRLLQGAAGAATLAAGLPALGQVARRRGRAAAPSARPAGSVITKGRINQSVCQWCFNSIPLETLAQNCKAMGMKSIELVAPKDWPILKKHGLICALASSHDLTVGFNDKDHHALCIDKVKESIDACAAAGFPTVITFSGLRKGIPDDVGVANAVEGLKKVVGYAEQKKVTLCLEVLNSRVDVEMKGHPDYMCDKVEWAAEVCKQVASPRMTILFDIYHVQVMQGDIITRIKQVHEYVGHYHVAGVPGRNEMDDNQELNYPPILRTIVETGYKGYVGIEFIPTRDPMQSLREAVKLCDV